MGETVAVTFGKGRFRGVAAALTSRWNRLNAYPCIDLTDRIPWDDVGPVFSYGKMYAWEVLPPQIERIIWVDSDTFVCRDIPLEKLPDVPLAAVRNGSWQMQEFRKNAPKGTPLIRRLFNAGVFVARRRETEPVFREVRKHRFDEYVGYYEQPWFNVIVQEMLGGWTELPAEFNWRPNYARKARIYEQGRYPYIIHTAGWVDLTVVQMLYHVSEGASWKALQEDGS